MSTEKTSMSSQRSGRIRIGIIGATPERGWANFAHIPAIKAVPSIVLHAVATRSERSARAAAAAFNAPLWFDNPQAMIAHEEVDAVVIAVKAPDHFELARQALLLGKPVYCEWPFGRTIEESRELEKLESERGIATAVGLQGRYSPWVRQVRDLVRSGALGRILSSSLVAYDELSLGTVDQGNAYLLDPENGANPLTVHTGHYLDAVCFALGELEAFSAVTAVSRPTVKVRQSGETVVSRSPDQIAIAGVLGSNVVFSFHMRAGTGDPSFLWEIQGDDRVLRISSNGYLMWRPLKLQWWDHASKTWEAIAEPSLEVDGVQGPVPDGPAQFVSYIYAAFARDVLTGSRTCVSFADALTLRESIESIRSAAIVSPVSE